MFKHLGTLIYTGSSTQEELFFMSANLSLLPSSLPPFHVCSNDVVRPQATADKVTHQQQRLQILVSSDISAKIALSRTSWKREVLGEAVSTKA